MTQDPQLSDILEILTSSSQYEIVRRNNALIALRSLSGYDKELRLLACRVACRALKFYENVFPRDLRPRQAIETSILFVDGKASKGELRDAEVGADRAWYIKEEKWTREKTAADSAATSAAYAAIGNASESAASALWAALFGLPKNELRIFRQQIESDLRQMLNEGHEYCLA